MFFVADFHIHTHYSRATSQEMDIDNLNKWAQIKGIKVLGTGDFTHPLWFSELKEKLVPAEEGLFRLRSDLEEKIRTQVPLSCRSEVRFILTAEISSIYSKNGKTRKVHNLIFAPSFGMVEEINRRLGQIGNLKADGRPILGLDCRDLAKIVFGISEEIMIVPSHAWTPWFSIFGSNSGFDSIEECFEEFTPKIFAIETGLSSDPSMNWRLSALDRITLISNSDAHSPQKLGREANVFDTELSYSAIKKALQTKNPQEFLFTIEFYPEEGKYHFDGHRLCQVRFSPQETKEHFGMCPTCGRPLTIGVINRVEKLADRPLGTRPKNVIPYRNLIPLIEIVSEAIGVGPDSQGAQNEYQKLIKTLGNELRILLKVGRAELEKTTLPLVAEGIIRNREGKVQIKAGYDGEYGKIKIFEEKERTEFSAQPTLF